jgi:hypothetical protein
MAKTADRLIAGVKRRVIIPASQPLMGDSDFLSLADDVIAAKMVPMISATRQDFFVTSTLVDCVSGTSVYSIPYRAIGRSLRDLKLVDSNGSKQSLALLALEDEHMFSTSGTPHGFYFKGDKLVLVPAPNSSDYDLEMWYEFMPSRLVTVASSSTVASTTTTVITVDQVPAGITPGVTVDFIQGISGNSVLAFDKTVQSVTTTTITFTSGDIPTALGAGDYIALSGQSPVIMLPDEAYPILETHTAIRVLNSIGDFEGAGSLREDAKEEEKNLLKILEPRITGENTKIINRNSLLRGSRNAYRRGYFR